MILVAPFRLWISEIDITWSRSGGHGAKWSNCGFHYKSVAYPTLFSYSSGHR
jgi:hypothetical protein